MKMRVYKNSEAVSYQLDHAWWRKKAFLTVSGRLLIDLKSQQSLPDKVLWDHSHKSLHKIQAGVAFDQGKAKVRAEFFVGGTAYAYDAQTRDSSVSVSVGALKKSLNVFGERFWVKSGLVSTISRPEPFNQIPLSWHNSFGGSDFAANPLGMGMAQNAQQLWPLPPIESPYDPLTHASQKPSPAGFLPMSMTSPKQRQRLGTFDEHWLKEAWPYLPDDHDPLYWNMAESDQQQQAYWQGNEQIYCEHLHPTKPSQHYELADHKIRAFYQRRDQAPEELRLNFDTIWLFPDLEQAFLIWHGTVSVHDEIASDMEAVLLVEENRQTGTLAKEDYFAQLVAKKIRQTPPLVVPEVASKPVEPAKVPEAVLAARAKAAEQKAKNAALMDSIKKQGEAALAGLTGESKKAYDKFMATPVTAPVYDPKQSLLDFKNKLLAGVEGQLSPKMKAEWDAFHLLPSAPTDFKAIREDLAKHFASVPKSVLKPETISEAALAVDQAEAAWQRAEAQLASMPARQKTLTQEETISEAIKNKKFENKRIDDYVFTNQTFDDFSFKNCQFKNCQFNYCTFSDSVLEQLRFELCVLTQVSINHCQMSNAHFKQCQLDTNHWQQGKFEKLTIDDSTIKNSTFVKLVMNSCLWKKNHFSGCEWQAGKIQQLTLNECTFKKIKFHDINLTSVHSSHNQLEDIEFIQVVMKTVSFIGAGFKRCHFDHVEGSALSFNECTIERLTFKKVAVPLLFFKTCQIDNWQVTESSLTKLSVVDSRLNVITITHSDLKNSRLTHLLDVSAMQLSEVNLQEALITDCSFSEFYMDHCVLTKSIWQSCLLDKAVWKANNATLGRFMDCLFSYCLLENNNFFSANFKRARFNETQVLSCNLYRVNFYHAVANRLKIKDCLLEDPLPVGFWERWRIEGGVV